MQNRFIDLYSDTKTKPSPGMRKAMADAEVGDEQKMEDPTVNRLRERVCALLGKEDSLFLPSGTMANQIAIRVHCRLGDEVIADRTAHIINAETGGPAANSGVMIRAIEGPNGVFTGEQIKAALRDPNMVREACRWFPGRVAVGIDARGGRVAVQGWAETSELAAVDLARRFEDAGVAAIIYTDIDRDGVLKGLNLAATLALADSVSIPVIASGGLADLDDIRALLQPQYAKLEGAITGRALYDGRLDAKAALALLASQETQA